MPHVDFKIFSDLGLKLDAQIALGSLATRGHFRLETLFHWMEGRKRRD